MIERGSRVAHHELMNVEWAVQQIDAFLDVTQQVAYPNNPNSGVFVMGTTMRGSENAASEAAHVVERILDVALPDWRKRVSTPDREYAGLRDQASRGRAALLRDHEIVEMLGDAAPRVSLGELHPWVWDAAKGLWADGHRALAVQQAAIAVNTHTQAKLARRDVSETQLFQQSFSSDSPTSGAPRLRVDGDPELPSTKNRQRGAMALAEGLYSAIRNPLGHELAPEWDENVALEMLSAFSMLARWVDEASVERVSA